MILFPPTQRELEEPKGQGALEDSGKHSKQPFLLLQQKPSVHGKRAEIEIVVQVTLTMHTTATLDHLR